MRRVRAVWGSLLFTIVVPGTVAALLPWFLTHWRSGRDLPQDIGFRIAGIVLIVAGLPVLLHAIYRFAIEGSGTPAPIAPTEHLVVGGPNRFVRNPMYIAVVTIIVGQAVLLGRAELLWYAAIVAVGQVLFVHLYEEPALHRRFGEDYERYQREVPAWIPRRTPWAPTGG
ncbi:methyltransferase family protein [Nocardia sp. NPDC020380]|uniref:methyltransferase family protein n=1 Tax=Nocardia sp. NPDC020380 TaxID=3364309 RepID=UPI0037B20797